MAAVDRERSAQEGQQSELVRVGPIDADSLSLDLFAPPIDRGALEVNVGRTVEHNGGLLPASALRLLATVMGMWAAYPTAIECDVRRGRHPGGCPHRQGRIGYTTRALAMETFGSDGGSQFGQVDAALEALASYRTVFTLYDQTDGTRYRQGNGILSFKDRRASNGDALGFIAFDPILLESMLDGRLQLIPVELVRGLTRPTAIRTWIAVLLHPRTARLRVGESAEFAITGERPSIERARLGLPTRLDKLGKTLERDAERGNRLQNEWRLSVAERADGGLKLRIERLPKGSAVGDAKGGSRRRIVRQSETNRSAVGDANRDRNEPYRPSRDVRDVLETRARGARDSSISSLRGSRPDVAALRRAGVRVSKKMIATLDEIARQQGTKELDGKAWIAAMVEQRPPETKDAFAYVMAVDSRLSEERLERAARDEAAWEARKQAEAGRIGATDRTAGVEQLSEIMGSVELSPALDAPQFHPATGELIEPEAAS